MFWTVHLICDRLPDWAEPGTVIVVTARSEGGGWSMKSGTVVGRGIVVASLCALVDLAVRQVETERAGR